MARYGTREEVYVTPYPTATIKYGFLTSVKESTRTALGHVAVNRAALPEGLVFGANAPKPGKASQTTAAGSESSFYDVSKSAALKVDGWRLSFPTVRRGKTGRKSTCVYVTIDGIKYAWMQNNETHGLLAADASALGLELGTSDDIDLVWGARFPRPPRAYKTGADNRTISTFVDPSKIDSLPPGWASGSTEFISV